MFQVNDVIIYGAQGVCKIVGIEEKTVDGAKKKYFVLRSVSENGTTIFAPMDSERILQKMRRLLTVEEIKSLIDSMPKEETIWIANENERREYYKSIIAGGDHLELIKMIKSIYLHKKEREAEGKRLHVSDEYFFKNGEQILYDEFRYVLQLGSKDELLQYILARVEK